MNRTIYKLVALFFSFILLSCSVKGEETDDGNYVKIPLFGNTYVTTEHRYSVGIGESGITKWKDPAVKYSAWFKVIDEGELTIALRAKTKGGQSKIKVVVNGKPFTLTVENSEWKMLPVGEIIIDAPQYVRVDFEGVEKEKSLFADISDIGISGKPAEGPLHYLHDFETYWGRRGPSVHMGYTLPEGKNVEWFYNEVTVPVGNDVIGSYYMSNGFSGGYFGMQVNSETERKVLFSVWSPFETDNPNEIPKEDRITTLARGEDVHIGEFGNEGSGGQSYLNYPWKAGNTYKFLTRIYPEGNGNTIFTSYFFATDENRWRLIASFRRPKTDMWYQGAHSFLENFIPEQGFIQRRVLFSNQWAVTSEGEWIPVTEGRFTYDNTAAAGVRHDYQGGMEDGSFYLQNCGFFDENTVYQTVFTFDIDRNVKPEIDLKNLPVE